MNVRKITISAFLLALCYVLPLLSMNVMSFGNALCLIHIPVFLAGLLLGWQYALLIGIIAPISRSLIFGAPILYPNAIGMSFELAAYGVISGLMYRLLKKTKLNDTVSLIISLLAAMILGRFVWGVARLFLTLFSSSTFTFKLFITNAFINSWPGVILQIFLVPILVKAIDKTHIINNNYQY